MPPIGKMLIVGGILIIALIIGIVIDMKRGKAKRELSRDDELDTPAEPEVTVLSAEVIHMACGVNTVGTQGYKQPKVVKTFLIKFRDKDGKIFDIQVNEEMYAAFELGQCGSLTLIDGKIDSFVLDEEEE